MSTSSKQHTMNRLSLLGNQELIQLWKDSKGKTTLRRSIKEVLDRRKQVKNFLKGM